MASTKPTPAPAPTFSAADAQFLIQMAESAPLANMRQAVEAQDVLQRAVAYFNGVFAPPAEHPGTMGGAVRDAVSGRPGPAS